MVYYHKVGTQQSRDELVYQDQVNPQRFHIVGTTEDERFAILNISERGKGRKGNAIFFRDDSKGEKPFKPVFADITDDSYSIIDNVGEKFLIETNKNAPNWKVFSWDPANPGEKNWKDVLPEKSEPLQGISTAGGKIFARYM